ncbi:hypothetical protein [Nocardia terpenica]|uniref:Uncharacterized protein n=1 Tax=Nocardia terpenica TaxID=455432 RepID=A0A6G9YVJ1_9NOCA|nr:hypothetical protein [Nocardia terpenica]QIS17170.1 hypothetical protein F6W96_01410 [Nocardia terpenica]
MPRIPRDTARIDILQDDRYDRERYCDASGRLIETRDIDPHTSELVHRNIQPGM